MESISYAKFSEHILDKSKDLKLPLTVSIELTYGCNLNCVHCYNPTHKALPAEMRFHELCGIMEQLPELGCLEVLFTGGEPLVRPEAFDLFHHAKNLGLQPVIFTNATLLDENIIKKLESLKPSYLSVSIYGWTKKTYENITRVSGSFEKFKRGLDLLLNSDLKVHYKMPVMTLNLHEFETIQDWFTSRNLPFNYAVDISPRVDGNSEPLKYRLPPMDAANFRATHEMLAPDCGKQHRSADHRSMTKQTFDCHCGKKSAAITPYGEMNLCTSMAHPKYQLSTSNVREGWNALVEFVENATDSSRFPCGDCDVANFCSQGAMDGWLEKQDWNACVPYFKETASKILALKEGQKSNASSLPH